MERSSGASSQDRRILQCNEFQTSEGPCLAGKVIGSRVGEFEPVRKLCLASDKCSLPKRPREISGSRNPHALNSSHLPEAERGARVKEVKLRDVRVENRGVMMTD